ncbi:hypothetical protein KBA63_05245 [Candidatus Woesebacteria bacterium]|jgi:hypothetical protein|nr:hypothetical protein [Candidatus Woesebacteria bacterium]MBP9687881.1 hypothetical protein [Candidatus Woesebacteria bacterium]
MGSQLTKQMYEHGSKLFGLFLGLRGFEIVRAHWFNADGEWLGQGGLYIEDVVRISEQLVGSELFIISHDKADLALGSFLFENAVAGSEYVAANADYIIAKGAVYSVDRNNSFFAKHGLPVTFLNRDEAREMIFSFRTANIE